MSEGDELTAIDLGNETTLAAGTASIVETSMNGGLVVPYTSDFRDGPSRI
jgi:hypothetical protein